MRKFKRLAKSTIAAIPRGVDHSETLEARVLLSGSAPVVVSGAATGVSLTGATLNATVTPAGATTNTYFQYSTSSSLPPTTVLNTFTSGFGRPTGLAIDAAGDVFVADYQESRIIKILPDGTTQTLTPTFPFAEGIAVDAAGDVFVGDATASSITEILPNGTTQTIGSGFSYPSGLAVDAAGDVFVADSAHNAVKEILPGGTIQTVGSGFNNPYTVAVDGSGDVFVADYGNNAVKEVLPDGTVLTLGSGFSQPSGVAVDASGDVFVGDHGNNQVKEILPDGTVLTLGSGFHETAGVAVNAAGSLYVADQLNSRVVELSSPLVAAAPASLSGTSSTDVSDTLAGLTPGTTYYDRIVSTDPAGGLVVGAMQSFTTQATPSLSLNAVNIPYGIALSNSQITGIATATVNGNAVTVPGVYTFTSASGTVLNAGSTGEAVTFTPGDTSAYTIATSTAQVNVALITPALTAAGVETNYTGSSFPATVALTNIDPAFATSLSQLLQLSYKDVDTSSVSTTAPSSPGRYEILAGFTGNANFAPIATQDTGQRVVIDPFAKLTDATIHRHRPRKLFTGRLATSTLIPGGFVTIELAGVTRVARIKSSGSFARRLPTAHLAAGSYTVQYTYAGPIASHATTWDATLIVKGRKPTP